MIGITNAMVYKESSNLMLFSYGTTYSAITGGWTKDGYTLSGYANNGNIYLENDYIKIVRNPSNYNTVAIFGTVNSFDVTNYKTLNILFYCTEYNSYTKMRCGMPTVKAGGYDQEFSQSAGQSLITNTLKLYTWDISSLTGNRYMMFNNHDAGGSCAGRVYEVYLSI